MRVDLATAPNPGLMTGRGTNTWVVESGGESVVIDPGPMVEGHLDRVRSLLAGSTPVAVLVTHTHPDHAPAANPLAVELGAPAAGRADGPGFVADRVVVDGDEIAVGGKALVVVATPGHTPDSTSYRIDDILFTGDHIIGDSTVVVEDMSAYMASLERLEGTGLARLHPGHGAAIEDPDATIRGYLAHRRGRERAILDAVRRGAATVDEVVEEVYGDVDRRLHPVAAVSVAAHLRKLAAEGHVAYAAADGTIVSGTPT